MDLTWIKQHKLVAGLFGAAALGAIVYSFVARKSSSGTASSVVGSGSTTGSPQYLVPVVQGMDQGSMMSPSVPLTGTGPTPSTTPASVIATNPYGVGTKVTSNEVITQSVYDPLYGAWVNLTSKGGIYTSPGASVSGSGYNSAWQGSGRVVLANGGASVQEYNAKNQLVGTYKIGK